MRYLTCAISGMRCALSGMTYALSDLTCVLTDMTCVLSDMTSVLSDMTCVLTDLACVLSDLTCVLSDMTCVLSDLTCVFPDVTCVLCVVQQTQRRWPRTGSVASPARRTPTSPVWWTSPPHRYGPSTHAGPPAYPPLSGPDGRLCPLLLTPLCYHPSANTSLLTPLC